MMNKKCIFVLKYTYIEKKSFGIHIRSKQAYGKDVLTPI